MDSLVIAALLPLAQATENASQPGKVAGRIFQEMLSGPNLIVALLGLVMVAVIQVLAMYISAKVVVGEPRGTFANAFKLWVLSIVVGIGFILLLGVLLPIAAMSRNELTAISMFAGAFLLLIAVIFLVPMKLFRIGFFKALAFLVLTTLLTTAVQVALVRAQGKPAFGDLRGKIETLRSPEKRGEFFKRLTTGEKPTGLDADLERLAQADERAKPFSERQTNLRKIYDDLEARQKTLPANDAKAHADYDRQRAKYEELVRIMKEDYAEAKAKGTLPAPAPAP